MLRIWSRSAGSYQVNTILVWDDISREAALFDPAGESDLTIAHIEELKLTPKYLINTHGHLDHITENHKIKARFKVPLLIHALDRPMLTDPQKNLSLFTGDPVVSPDADATLENGNEVRLGEFALKTLHVPGHTSGSLCFYHPPFVISGDTLFAGGVGRTDLPGGDERVLFESIRAKLYTLPSDTVVHPGHGPTTTIGKERRTNPFVRG